jgi:hypothetical protein
MKKLLYTLLLCCFGTGMLNAQCNDIFTNFNGNSNFWQITGFGTPLFDAGNCDASWNIAPGTFNSGDLIIFDVTAGNIYNWQTCGQAGWDTYIRLWDANSLALVAFNDDACGLQSSLTWVAPFTGQVWLGVTHFVCTIAPQTDTYGLLSTCLSPVPPPNDAACGATPLGVPTAAGVSAGFNSLFATPDGPSPGAGTGAGGSCESLDGWCSFETAVDNDVWFTFIAPPSGNVIIDAGPFDTQVAVWLVDDCEDLAAAIEVYANDDSGPGFAAQLADACGAISYIPGTEYYIQIDGFAGTAGNAGVVTVTEVPAGAPTANDFACDAIAIAVGGCAAYDNECATADAGEVDPGPGTGPSSCNSQDGWCAGADNVENSVWYTFTAPASGCVSININPTDGFDDMQLAVWSATDCNDYATFSELAGNDDGGATLFAPLIDELACLTPGETYYVQLDGYFGTIGAGDICITDCGNDLLAADAGACQSRFLGYCPVEGDTNFLVGSASGGFPPYTYSWSGAGILYTNGASAAVQPGVTTTYTLTVTDAKGCVATSDVTVNVLDICCYGSGSGSDDGRNSSSSSSDDVPVCKKVQVCVYPKLSSGSGSGSDDGSGSSDDGPRTKCIKLPKSCTGSGSGSSSDDGQNSSDDNKDKVAKELAKNPLNHLGPCGNPCLATNPYFAPPPPCVDVTVDLLTDSFGSETSWELLDGGGNQVMAAGFQFTGTFLTSNTAYSVTECLDPSQCYTFNIYDSFGDGICCFWGQGTYSITFDGAVVAQSNAGNNAFLGVSQSESVGNCAAPKTGDPAATSAASALAEQHIAVRAYPNPFSATSTIEFILEDDADVSVEVFNITGVKVANLFNGPVAANNMQRTNFNASSLADGIYIYKITTSTGVVQNGKLYLIK